jgi:transposase
VRDSFTAVLQTIAQQMRALETAIVALIDADPLWARLNAAFREIKGVAGRTVARLLADLAEIGTLSGKAVAKLNGGHRLRATAARRSAAAWYAADARVCGASSIWLLRWFAGTIPTSSRSMRR